MMAIRALVALVLLAALGSSPAAGEDSVVLRFTLPLYHAGAVDGCAPGTVVLDSLRLVELWRYTHEIALERARPPAVQPGEEETLLVFPGTDPVTFGVTVLGRGARRSCMSNLVTFNGRVDAGPAGGPGAGPWLGLPRPNPTGGLVAVSWCLPSAARMRLEVVDLAGRVVARLADSDHAAGVHVSVWDARRAAPGIYLLRARSGRWTAVARVLVLH